ncbi:MAG: hypothetical protein ABEJ91_01960 [Candidatus Nanohaloarchaea archaeon]
MTPLIQDCGSQKTKILERNLLEEGWQNLRITEMVFEWSKIEDLLDIQELKEAGSEW